MPPTIHAKFASIDLAQDHKDGAPSEDQTHYSVTMDVQD